MAIYRGWWLTLAGTVLRSNITAGATRIPVSNAEVGRAIFIHESRRAGGWRDHACPIRGHCPQRADCRSRVLFHAYLARAGDACRGTRHQVARTWMLNVTPYCAVDPSTGLDLDAIRGARRQAVACASPMGRGAVGRWKRRLLAHLERAVRCGQQQHRRWRQRSVRHGWQDGVTRLLGLMRSSDAQQATTGYRRAVSPFDGWPGDGEFSVLFQWLGDRFQHVSAHGGAGQACASDDLTPTAHARRAGSTPDALQPGYGFDG